MSLAVDVSWPLAGGDLESGIARLRDRGDAAESSLEARLAALSALSDAILKGDPAVRAAVPSEGLAFLSAFLRADNLRSLIAREVADLGVLDGFVRVGPRKSLRLVPRGVVSHWVAGNVPLLGAFSWALSAVLGNGNVMRLSSRQGDVMSPLLAAVARVDSAGQEMAERTLVVSFPREASLAHGLMSAQADARIAWGGREAVDAIRDLPAHWDCQDIVFGPRASLAVIDPASISSTGIGRLATDAVVFDQLACSSPQTVFVRGQRGEAGFESFVAEFRAAFERQSGGFPRHALDFAETFRISLDRARVVLEGGSLYRDQATQWTIGVLAAPCDRIECANRFVQLIPYTELEAIYPYIPRNVQTCVIQLQPADADRFTERAARLGVCRFPLPGEGNHFENPWDGVGLVSRLTRSVVRTEAAKAAR